MVSGVPPRTLRPVMRKDCHDIEERIANVTDPKRTHVDLYNAACGRSATRETRMEVVAWFAVCKHDCKLEGGFVRDWIIGHYSSRPQALINNPKSWITQVGSLPAIHKEVVPCDLDCHLSSKRYFDIEKFRDDLYKYGITCTVHRQEWRYVLLFDENERTGPFTMDMIEPHVVLTHDRIDFDVNNLSIEKDYTHEIGMRVDIRKGSHPIDIEDIVKNIKQKKFQVLRPRDTFVVDRFKKMVDDRGWTNITPDISIIPEPHAKVYAIVVPLPASSVTYKDLEKKMQRLTGLSKIISIEEIRNPNLEDTYYAMRRIIARQCPNDNPNEMELFHGTKHDVADGIIQDGYDDRFFSSGGLYGEC